MTSIGFWESFCRHSELFPDAPFVVDGTESLLFHDAKASAERISLADAEQYALQSNDARSVLCWLRLEKNRFDDGRSVTTDYVSTSGSTGAPKVFRLPLSSQLVTAEAINSVILAGAPLDEVLLLPLTHSSARGRLRAAVLRGCTIYLAGSPITLKKISPKVLGDSAFGVAVTPTTYRYLSKRFGGHLGSFFSGLRSIEFGSAPLRQDEIEELRQSTPVDILLVMHFGLTEASRSFLRDLRKDDWNDLGTPMPHTEFRLMGDGELMISGPHTALPAEVSDTAMGSLEVATGDLCEMDNGRLRLIGRKKNLINVGGYKIQPEVVEAQFGSSRVMNDVVVVGVDDPLLGERPVVFVRHADGTDAHEFFSHLALSEPAWASAKIIEISEFPLIGPGKINRQLLRSVAATRGGL